MGKKRKINVHTPLFQCNFFYLGLQSQLQSVAIAVAISCNQLQSVAISCNQLQSVLNKFGNFGNTQNVK